MIRDVVPRDEAAVLGLVESSGLFDTDGIEQVRQTLTEYLEGRAPGLWYLSQDDDGAAGVAYCSPEPMTRATWNLLMLVVDGDRHGRGHGRALVRHVERALTARAARLLLIETSGLESFARTRAFYAACGYTEEARIRDFYAAGDDKVVFTRALPSDDRSASPPPPSRR